MRAGHALLGSAERPWCRLLAFPIRHGTPVFPTARSWWRPLRTHHEDCFLPKRLFILCGIHCEKQHRAPGDHL